MHDIGKNIVGVVLSCNGYRVIDLGVMVSVESLLRAIQEHQPDILGLSGLITPSLDEMIFNAKEFERMGLKIPLLIGGATTSRAHTAIKIAPHYSSVVVHVADASLSASVCSKLMSQDSREAFVHGIKEQYLAICQDFAAKSGERIRNLVTLDEARIRSYKTDWSTLDIPRPRELGIREYQNVDLKELEPFIDWSPLFWAWGLKGVYPQILSHEKHGAQARELLGEAQEMLKKFSGQQVFRPRAVAGLFAAQSEGDDIQLYSDEISRSPLCRFHFLRQQQIKAEGQPYFSLADFVAPVESGRLDYVGAFCVTMGSGVESKAEQFKQQGDDFSSIMVKALGDRLAEAIAEWLHWKTRILWGIEAENKPNLEDLLKERYRGIRPAPGYPACPEHSEKEIVWKLLSVEKRIAVRLTESFAMTPASSVSGLYFAHPAAKYFMVGGIGEDQVADYARRKGLDLKLAEKWLEPVLIR